MVHKAAVAARETLIHCLCGRIAVLRGTRNIGYHVDMSRFLRSVRLAFHPAQAINQGFPNTLQSFLMQSINVSRWDVNFRLNLH